METKNRYVIDKSVYEKHIDDEVHLYSMLHQLAFQAGRVKDAEDMAALISAAKRYGETADDLFDDWAIPGRYLVFGEKKDLAALREKELEPLSALLAEHDAEKMSKALEQASWNLPYIIHGSSFRLLVGDIHNLIVLYYSLARRLSEAETEKDFLRLKKRAGNYEKEMKRIYRSLGLPEGSSVAHDVLEESIVRRHHMVCLEDVEEEPLDEGDLEGDEVWSD